MQLNAAAHILFNKDYEQLTDSEAEEVHEFREMQEAMAEMERWVEEDDQ